MVPSRHKRWKRTACPFCACQHKPGTPHDFNYVTLLRVNYLIGVSMSDPEVFATAFGLAFADVEEVSRHAFMRMIWRTVATMEIKSPYTKNVLFKIVDEVFSEPSPGTSSATSPA